jgi:hypothetical protein
VEQLKRVSQPSLRAYGDAPYGGVPYVSSPSFPSLLAYLPSDARQR